MKYVVTINDKKYEVEVEKGVASVLSTTTVAPVAVVAPVVAVAAPVATPVVATVATPVTTNVSGEAIKAPMPGVILAVKTAPGTAVKKGDIIFILEAMKMENEIFAPRDGVIAQVVVAKGASVNTGDILASIQ